MKMNATVLLLFFCFSVHADIDWKVIVNSISENPQSHHLTPIPIGASNKNYLLQLGKSSYFLRMAPSTSEMLLADLAVEYDVLQKLSHLNISAHPYYFDPEKKLLITDYIPHDDDEINLLNPDVRRKVIELVHKIESAQIEIFRKFKPYQYVTQLIKRAQDLPPNTFSKEFYQQLMPALKQIDEILCKNPRKSLCHLDLHHQNLLKQQDRFWIVDWEYAVMSHPFLSLASMASIERWDDTQMLALLKEYKTNPSMEDIYNLYLYRIVVDIFWTAWNNVQVHYSILDNPYREWGRLFEKAALQRVRSYDLAFAMSYLKYKGSFHPEF